MLRYCRAERNILAKAQHPNIVSLHWAFQTETHLVLVLQLCPRGNLRKLIQDEGKLQEPLVRHYSAQVLLALCFLHDRQTIYRDLKPENVVIDAHGHALLTDFGLSKEGVEGARGTGSFCGSVAFLAPEILKRRGHGQSVDVYNLGVVLFNMFTGMPPFFHHDQQKLYSNIRYARLNVPPYVPKVARELIVALMDRDPARRPGATRTTDVQRHPFFATMDFDALYRREVEVPPAGSNLALRWREAGITPAQSVTRHPRWPPNSPFSKNSQRDDPLAVSGWEFAALQAAAAPAVGFE